MTEHDYVWICPGRQFGEPCLGGTRLPAGQFALVWWGGKYTLEEMTESWPDITRGNLMVACWYMARFANRTWRQRWRAWADQWASELWHGNYGKVPMPPQAKEAQP